MPLSVAQIAANTASVTFQYSGESVTVVYFPSLVTEKTFAQLTSFYDMKLETLVESFSGLNDILSRMIKSWDVYDDAEQTVMFPLVPDRLMELPIEFRTQVLGAIMKSLNPESLAA